MELSRLEQLNDLFIQAVSRLVWRNPHRRILKMFEFSFTEEDSFRDMARAAELTPSPEMRARYLVHALDEARHADLFRSRARALIERLEAAGEDTTELRQGLEHLLDTTVRLHETYHHNTLFESLGELEFLAFVYVAERRGAQQFRIYNRLLEGDPETQAMFLRILNEEKFHMSYSRLALDRMAKEGRGREVRWALLRVRTRRYWQSWLRFCRRFADVSNTVLFGLLYFVVVGPFALLTRPPPRPLGWMEPEQEPGPDVAMVRRQF